MAVIKIQDNKATLPKVMIVTIGKSPITYTTSSQSKTFISKDNLSANNCN